MCFTLDAEPPSLPVSGGPAHGEDLVLTSRDGTRFAAYAGHVDAPTPSPAGIVILPDVRGLFNFYRELALRFAEAGIEAVAVDYFGRTTSLGQPRDEHFDFMSHITQTTPDNISADVAAAVDYLHTQPGGATRKIFTVGFCFGGRYSFLQAASIPNLAGVIGYYGRPSFGNDGQPGPIQRVGEFTCPVLGFFGGADHGIPADQIAEYDRALTQAGIEHELITYPGAPHSFFDRHQAAYEHESADSWQRVLDFIHAHS